MLQAIDNCIHAVHVVDLLNDGGGRYYSCLVGVPLSRWDLSRSTCAAVVSTLEEYCQEIGFPFDPKAA
jgi:hypothetical protein